MHNGQLDLRQLRDQMIGADVRVQTPYGERPMVYGDYTASGRGLYMVDRYMEEIQELYANTHTEDSLNGRAMSHLLHQAEEQIKRYVNAGPNGRLIAVGTGATGAIDKLQQILGIALPPATRRRLWGLIEKSLGTERAHALEEAIREHQPVVFVGPYEHHSNEISWRANLSTVVDVGLTEDGAIDVAHLESLLLDPRYADRPKIGSFSAASNVTGRRSPLRELARLMHRHGGHICVDFAASAPYVEIDMNPEGDPEGALDAIFVSPHKFLGGPGSSGILVFNEALYPCDLPPTVSAGGTVDYVSPADQDYIAHIEEREKPGTPGVLQTLRAALAFQIKERVTVEQIEAREHALLERAFARWAKNDAIEVLGHPDPSQRVGIVSFNIKCTEERYLHPKFATALFSDLFGIQTRAGCSCAGPYGHRLLGIGLELSERYRAWIQRGYHGIKPGWCRVSFHYAMDDLEIDYLLDAIDFVAEHGHRFLVHYEFEPATGAWRHRRAGAALPELSIDGALKARDQRPAPLSEGDRREMYRSAMEAAQRELATLQATAPCAEVSLGALGPLQFFQVVEDNVCAEALRIGLDEPVVELQPAAASSGRGPATASPQKGVVRRLVSWIRSS